MLRPTWIAFAALGLAASGWGAGCLVEIAPLDVGAAGGGTGGTSATGGGEGGGGGGSGGGGSAIACPPDMVYAADDATGIAFCVDRTEVTQASYLAFLSAVGEPENAEQPAECSWNDTFTHTPDGSCPDFATASDLPVWCVDWCDAYAYCAWADKRLCGATGGGPLSFGAGLSQDEWHFACSGGFLTEYPYGDAPEVGACNIPKENTPDDPSDDAKKAPVASFPECEGGFDGLFDMQGNVSEWTARCEPSDGLGNEQCATRGGHTYSTAEYWTCKNLKEAAPRNDANLREVGIRCCRDADE